MLKEISDGQKAHDLAIAHATSLSILREGIDEGTFYQEYKNAYEIFLKLVRES